MAEPEWSEELRQRIAAQLRAAGVPGASLALVINGRTWSSAVGHRDLEGTAPLAPDAVLPIYSVTKPMIATAIVALVGRGQLGLDQTVNSVLTEIELDPRIMVRHLLNHSGGLGDYGGMDEYNGDLRRDPTQPWSDDAFLSRVLGRGPRFAPGDGWAYSNIGYLLLRRILTETTQRSFRQALTDLIFEPLALGQTLVVETLADGERLAPGYSAFFASDGAPADVRPLYHPGWVSHGLVASTVAEVATFLEALLDGRLVAPALVDAMLAGIDVGEPHPRFRRPTYGLGLMVDPESPFGVVAGHGGAGPGYSAGAFHFPSVRGRRVTSVALVNSDGGELGLELAFAMVDLLAVAGGADIAIPDRRPGDGPRP